jgi:hypothetical protein
MVVVSTIGRLVSPLGPVERDALSLSAALLPHGKTLSVSASTIEHFKTRLVHDVHRGGRRIAGGRQQVLLNCWAQVLGALRSR